jgi:hypothetical protein
MEFTNYLKCSCANCGGPIEYPPGDAGQIIECPKCKEKSRLPGTPSDLRLQGLDELPPKPLKKCLICGTEQEPGVPNCPVCAEERKKRRMLRTVLIAVSSLAVLMTAAVGWVSWQKGHLPPPPPSGPLPQPIVNRPKSINDLKIGKFYLEKRRGSDQGVAAGTIENDSGNVHFRIKAEVDLLDLKGAKVGTVSDIVTELGPRQKWEFLAAVTNTNAVNVRFATIKEDQ